MTRARKGRITVALNTLAGRTVDENSLIDGGFIRYNGTNNNFVYFNLIDSLTEGYMPVFSSNTFADSPIYVSGGQVGVTTPLLLEKTLKLNTSYTPTNLEVIGESYWDSDNMTYSDVLMNGVIGQRFQEDHWIIKNTSGTIIQNGWAVMFTGVVGASGKLAGGLAIADGSVPALYTIGIATHQIGIGEWGYVTSRGSVRGLDTTGTPFGETWNEGDILYTSPTSPGYLTNVEPQAPNLVIVLGTVGTKHSSNGILIVRPTWNPKLTDITGLQAALTNVTYKGELTNRYIPYYNEVSLALLDSIMKYDGSQIVIGSGTNQSLLVNGSSAIVQQPENIGFNILNSINESYQLRQNVFTGSLSGDSVFNFGYYYDDSQNSTIQFHKGAGSTGGFMSFTSNNGTERMRLTSDGNVGIGTTTPAYALDVVGNAGGNTNAILPSHYVRLGQLPTLSNLVTNAGTSTDNYVATFDGTTGKVIQSGKLLITDTGIIVPKFQYNTTSFYIGNGSGAAETNFSGSNNNVTVGNYTLNKNNGGDNNTAMGADAIFTNVTGSDNTGVGQRALRLTTASRNTAVGSMSGDKITTGTENTTLGYGAGSFITDGSTEMATNNYSIYIGSQSKALSNGLSNEIVLGYNAIGNGSNTVTLGNTSITNVYTSGKYNGTTAKFSAVGTGTLSQLLGVTSDGTLTIATDGSITYDKIANSLKQSATVTGSIDLSANAIGKITLSSNTAFSFSNYQMNKSYLLIITANGFTASFSDPSKHIFIEGNAPFETTGVFYVSITCIDDTSGSEKLLTTIMKEAV